MAGNINKEGNGKSGLKRPFTKKFVEEYWSAALLIVDAAGQYAAAVKLKNNIMDPSTRHKVEGVFDNYYHGRMSVLDDRIESARCLFDVRVKKFNLYCLQANETTITMPDRLLNILLNERRRESYKGKIRRRMQKGVVCRLQDFEK